MPSHAVRQTIPLIAAVCIVAKTRADLVVTDHGNTAPVLGAADTGYTGTMGQRFGFDPGEVYGQSFTLAEAGTLGSIFIAYNGFDDGNATFTITVDAGADDSVDLTETVTLDALDFSGDPATDNNDGAIYWMEWDLSSSALALPAGMSSFEIVMDSGTAGLDPSWLFAPMYASGNPYPDGEALGIVGAVGIPNSDFGFAVTIRPEPSEFVITQIGREGDVVTLTWTSGENITYQVFASTDLVNWGVELDDNVPGDPGDSTTRPFDLTEYQLEDEEQLFFRMERGG